jgi:hypothetical protein
MAWAQRTHARMAWAQRAVMWSRKAFSAPRQPAGTGGAKEIICRPAASNDGGGGGA